MGFQGKAPKTFLAALAGAGVLAAAAACTVGPVAPAGPEWVGWCVDTVTGVRVPDVECGTTSIYTYDWIDTYRYPNYVVPRYGSRVNITNITVVHNPPKGASRSTSIPSSGGEASSVRTSGGTKSSTSGAGKSSGSKGSSSVTRGGLGVRSSSGSFGGSRSSGS